MEQLSGWIDDVDGSSLSARQFHSLGECNDLLVAPKSSHT
jgi:hypothetical protein